MDFKLKTKEEVNIQDYKVISNLKKEMTDMDEYALTFYINYKNDITTNLNSSNTSLVYDDLSVPLINHGKKLYTHALENLQTTL